MADTERELLAKLRFSLDKGDTEAAKKAVDDIEGRLKKTGQAAEDAGKKFAVMREQAERMTQIGMGMTALGAAIAGPFLLAAKNYVQQAGQAEATSRRWTSATKDLEQAQLRVGRVAAKEALPYLEKAADLAEKAASFVEQHPELVKGALTIGGTVAAAGTAVTLAAQAQKMVSNFGSLFGSLTSSGGLLSKLSSLFLGSTAGAVGGGLLAGFGVNEWLANTSFGQKAGFQTLGKFASVGAYGLGSAFGGDALGKEWFQSIAKLTGELKDTSAAADDAANELGVTNDQMRAYIDYKKSEAQALSEYNTKRSQLIADYNSQDMQALQDYNRQRYASFRDHFSQMRQLEADYLRSRTQAIQSFAQQEARTEQEYYQARKQAAKSYSTEIRRMEQDHQTEMRRLLKSHQNKIDDLARSQDAYGMLQEIRNYEDERQNAEEDYRTQMQRKRQDYAAQLAEQEQAFQSQRAQRLADFQLTLQQQEEQYELQKDRQEEAFSQQMLDQAEQFRIQRQRAQDNFTNQLNDLDAQYDSERSKRTAAFNQQLLDLDSALDQERILRNQFTDAMLADLQNKISSIESEYPGRASGGYVSSGLYRLHDHEFVLNSNATRAAEQVARGTLTQDKVMAMLAGSGGGQTITYNDHRTFDSRLSVADRAAIRSDTAVLLRKAFA